MISSKWQPEPDRRTLIKPILKGKAPYDASVAEQHGRGLKALSAYKVDRLFISKTSKSELPGDTRALLSICQNRADVSARFGEWEREVEALLAAVPEGEAAFFAQLKVVGRTCKACHDDYRAKRF